HHHNNSNNYNSYHTILSRNYKHWITDIRIPFYIVIFILAVVGNCLVILTLVQNKRMRTVTNVFLLNLSVSDLLLALFCMPFTLIPSLMRDFVFGKTVCVMIRYLQGVSVAVSCFTLVAISLERYFAICRPLQSRSWQTITHAYISIFICWALSGLLAIPIATYNKLVPYISFSKCEEKWPAKIGEQIYTSLLDLILLLVPILIMSMAYGMISFTLWKGIRQERLAEKANKNRINKDPSDEIETMMCSGRAAGETPIRNQKRPKHFYDYSGGMRQSNSEKSQAAKLRVIRMLFVIVIEFFVCWCPLYIIQTWVSFDSKGATENISPTLQSFLYLLAYTSSCTNPITYAFMNKKFRQGFLSVFRCCRVSKSSMSRRPNTSMSGFNASSRVGTSRIVLYDKVQRDIRFNSPE
ncbi:cholecystokinin receptor type A, partial [Argonauta hians]